MTKKVILSSVLLFFLSIGSVKAQNDEGQSGTVYSLYGSGMPLLNNTAQEKGMGILGVSFTDNQSVGLTNPAQWGSGIYTKIAANFDFTNYSIKDSLSSGNNSLLKIGSFQAIFPILKNKLGMSVALYPETRSSYNVNSVRTFNVGGRTNEFLSNRTGTGGVTKFEVGFGLRLTNNISLGYAPSYAFLTESENETIVFADNTIASNNVNTRINGTAVSHRFGLSIGKTNFLKADDYIRIGGAITLPTNFDSKRKSETIKQVGLQSVVVEVGNTGTANVGLPLKMSGGVSYFFNSKFNASTEFQLEKWDEAEYGFSASEENAFTNRYIYGAGFQYHPYRSRSTKFFSKFKYSAGISYDSGHLEINNNKIETLWFSAGLGLVSPDLRTNSSFDLSFQYGLRGTISNSLVKENIFAINLSVNLTELMFLRRKLN
ncbi:MAG: hypothetical protein JXR20_09510 [Balneola sp.]